MVESRIGLGVNAVELVQSRGGDEHMKQRALVMAISGGSASGKTTLAEAIARRLMTRRVVVVSEDDYYRDNGLDPTFVASEFNFDDVAAHDHALMLSGIKQLRIGRQAAQPVYCFVNHRREDATKLSGPAEIIILEGIHVLHTESVRANIDLSVYVDVSDDVRLGRRLLCDIVERGRDPLSVIERYIRTVRPMHYRYTYPGRYVADIVIHDDGHRLTTHGPSDEEIHRLVSPVLVRLEEMLTQKDI
jgi:uridine kinase